MKRKYVNLDTSKVSLHINANAPLSSESERKKEQEVKGQKG